MFTHWAGVVRRRVYGRAPLGGRRKNEKNKRRRGEGESSGARRDLRTSWPSMSSKKEKKKKKKKKKKGRDEGPPGGACPPRAPRSRACRARARSARFESGSKRSGMAPVGGPWYMCVVARGFVVFEHATTFDRAVECGTVADPARRGTTTTTRHAIEAVARCVATATTASVQHDRARRRVAAARASFRRVAVCPQRFSRRGGAARASFSLPWRVVRVLRSESSSSLAVAHAPRPSGAGTEGTRRRRASGRQRPGAES